MKIWTIREVLDNWVKTKVIDAVSDNVSDNDVWCMARMAAVIAGQRAQDIGNEKYEEACYEFVCAMDGIVEDKESPMTDAALTELLKALHSDMVDGINDFLKEARDGGLDYPETISNLMMLTAHVASTFAAFHFEFTEEAFTDIMREHYKMAMKGKPSNEPVKH